MEWGAFYGAKELAAEERIQNVCRNDVVVHSEVVSSDQGASNGSADGSVQTLASSDSPVRVGGVVSNVLTEQVGTSNVGVSVGSVAPLGGQGRVAVVFLNLVVSGGQDGGQRGVLLGLCCESNGGASESNGSGGCSSNGGSAEVTYEV